MPCSYQKALRLILVVSSVEEAFKQASSLTVAGALLETNVVAYYQPKLFGKYMNIQYSIEKEQNVTFLYLMQQIRLMKGAKDFIDCMELNLFPVANTQKISLKVLNFISFSSCSSLVILFCYEDFGDHLVYRYVMQCFSN